MFGKDTLVLPDGTYGLSEQRFKVDKIESPNGKKLSPHVVNQYGFLTFVYSNHEHTLKAHTQVISKEKRGLGIISPITINDINIEVSLDYWTDVMAQICDRVSGVLPMASGYEGSNWLGTVAESRRGGLENAMRDVHFGVIVPNGHYRPNIALMARDMPAINDLKLELRAAQTYLKSVYDIEEKVDPILKLVRNYFAEQLNAQRANRTNPAKTVTIPIF